MFMLKIAWRYVHARLINYVAVLVVGLTLMASIVVLGVIEGMLADMERRVRDLGEQVAIYFQQPVPMSELRKILPPDPEGKPEAEDAAGQLSGPVHLPPGVRGFTPVITDYALIKHGIATEAGVVYGIDLVQEMRYSALGKHLLDFKLDFLNPQWATAGADTSGRPCAFMGDKMAEKLTLKPGDIFEISYSPVGSDQLQRREFFLSSTYRSGSMMKDDYGLYIPLEEAQKMFLTPLAAQRHGVTMLSFFLDDPYKAKEMEEPVARAVIRAVHVGGVRTITWQQRWRSTYEGMAYENMLMEVVLFFMNFSAGFCVFAVLATLVSRRVRDVGLLRCMGAGRRHTVGIFLLVGLIIGLMGAVLGVASGYAVGLHINGIWKFFTGEALYPPHMFRTVVQPVIHVHKVAIYAGGAVLISVLSALYPAISAGCREPVDALRDE